MAEKEIALEAMNVVNQLPYDKVIKYTTPCFEKYYQRWL